MEEPRIVAFIPLRGGSKGIPGKNIRLLAGRPLALWALDAAVNCSLIDRVYVATDDQEIAAVIHAYGSSRVEVVDRGPETATDTASTESAMLEFAQRVSCDHVVLIQATSPLLGTRDLEIGLRKYLDSRADGLVSVVRQRRFIWAPSGEGFVEPVNYDPANRPRRQDFEGFLVENGAFYACSRARLLQTRARISGDIVAHEMPPESYYEVDDPEDWLIVERLLSGRRQPSGLLRLFLTDVDGVLTDAGMYYSQGGDELKKFNTRDGKAFELLRLRNVATGLITSEDTSIVTNRAKKLKIDHVFQGAKDKVRVFEQLIRSLGIPASEVAYVGDDLNDLELLRRVGFSAAPADALSKVREAVDFVTRAKGGEGCVREVVEFLLARGAFPEEGPVPLPPVESVGEGSRR